MIVLEHYDDGKGKYQSHEIHIINNEYNSDSNVFGYDFHGIWGYGETKEEALQDFRNKFNPLFNQFMKDGIEFIQTDNLERHISKGEE